MRYTSGWRDYFKRGDQIKVSDVGNARGWWDSRHRRWTGVPNFYFWRVFRSWWKFTSVSGDYLWVQLQFSVKEILKSWRPDQTFPRNHDPSWLRGAQPLPGLEPSQIFPVDFLVSVVQILCIWLVNNGPPDCAFTEGALYCVHLQRGYCNLILIAEDNKGSKVIRLLVLRVCVCACSCRR